MSIPLVFGIPNPEPIRSKDQKLVDGYLLTSGFTVLPKRSVNSTTAKGNYTVLVTAVTAAHLILPLNSALDHQ